MRKILMLTAALSFSFLAAQGTASAAPQCNCSFCYASPSAFCDIGSFHTSCAVYNRNFCEI
jgi:hypothetical protein